MRKHSKGFTLIELLVVIAIIGMLSSIVFASLNTARQKGRDAQRRVELAQLVKAIQLYYENNNSAYPSSGVNTISGDWPPNFKTALAPYLPKLPVDPTANESTRYYAFYQLTWNPSEPSPGPCLGRYVVWGYLEHLDSKSTCGWGANHFFQLVD